MIYHSALLFATVWSTTHIMYDMEEETDNEMFYDSPSYFAPTEAEINNLKHYVPHTINLNKNSNPTPTPNPKNILTLP